MKCDSLRKCPSRDKVRQRKDFRGFGSGLRVCFPSWTSSLTRCDPNPCQSHLRSCGPALRGMPPEGRERALARAGAPRSWHFQHRRSLPPPRSSRWLTFGSRSTHLTGPATSNRSGWQPYRDDAWHTTKRTSVNAARLPGADRGFLWRFCGGDQGESRRGPAVLQRLTRVQHSCIKEVASQGKATQGDGRSIPPSPFAWGRRNPKGLGSAGMAGFVPGHGSAGALPSRVARGVV